MASHSSHGSKPDSQRATRIAQVTQDDSTTPSDTKVPAQPPKDAGGDSAKLSASTDAQLPLDAYDWNRLEEDYISKMQAFEEEERQCFADFDHWVKVAGISPKVSRAVLTNNRSLKPGPLLRPTTRTSGPRNDSELVQRTSS